MELVCRVCGDKYTAKRRNSFRCPACRKGSARARRYKTLKQFCDNLNRAWQAQPNNF